MFAEEAEVVRISDFAFLLQAGGAPLLALGAGLAIWGFVNLLWPRNRHLILLQSLASLVVGIGAAVAVYGACHDFAELASLPNPPKPKEFAEAVGRAMSYSFCGLLATVTPLLLGAVAAWRCAGFGETTETEFDSGHVVP